MEERKQGEKEGNQLCQHLARGGQPQEQFHALESSPGTSGKETTGIQKGALPKALSAQPEGGSALLKDECHSHQQETVGFSVIFSHPFIHSFLVQTAPRGVPCSWPHPGQDSQDVGFQTEASDRSQAGRSRKVLTLTPAPPSNGTSRSVFSSVWASSAGRWGWESCVPQGRHKDRKALGPRGSRSTSQDRRLPSLCPETFSLVLRQVTALCFSGRLCVTSLLPHVPISSQGPGKFPEFPLQTSAHTQPPRAPQAQGQHQSLAR